MTNLIMYGEQVALFASCIDWMNITPELNKKFEGVVGICNMLAREAKTFCQLHKDTDWSEVDWYETSEDYFASNIKPKLNVED